MVLLIFFFFKFTLTFLLLFLQVNSSSSKLCSMPDSNKHDPHRRNPGNTSSKATILMGSWWCGGMTPMTPSHVEWRDTRSLGRTGQKEPRSQNHVQSCLISLLLIWMMMQSVSSASLLMTQNSEEWLTGCRAAYHLQVVITSMQTWTN